jgi:hypothetical protein
MFDRWGRWGTNDGPFSERPSMKMTRTGLGSLMAIHCFGLPPSSESGQVEGYRRTQHGWIDYGIVRRIGR